MNNKDFIIVLLLLIIPLLLMIICYRIYTNNYCRNDMKCMQEKLLNNLKKMNRELYNKKYELEHMQNKTDDTVEGFFGGLSNWFSGGGTPNGLPVAPGTLPKEDLSMLEKKHNNKMKQSSKFPPTDDDNEFKDSNNNELLNTIKINKQDVNKINNNKPENINKNNLNNNLNNNINNKNNHTLDKPLTLNNTPIDSNLVKKIQNVENMQNTLPSHPTDLSLKNILGTCQFFNDKCPDKYQPLGNFSISGNAIGNNAILTCGNVSNVKPAHAIAIIKSNSLYEINILDSGLGFNPTKPPKITIEGGKGSGATAEAIVDDNGHLKIIKIINPGYNYTETPNVIIEAPFMNSSCHLCCKI